MDVNSSGVTAGSRLVEDSVGTRIQKLFLDFLNDFEDDHDGLDVNTEPKYLKLTKELVKPERNTLSVSLRDVEHFNATLAQRITDDFYHVYPFLCSALRLYARERAELTIEGKALYISFLDLDAVFKVRQLTTSKIGHLLKITGQVVRTHPVHPELVSGTFTCQDCQSVTENVEQEFKFTQPSVCTNNVCNNRSRFTLDLNKSKFNDFQKVRVQEIQAELPRGCIPRALEVILRAECVEKAQPGDKCDFIGTLIAVPDVSSINLPGARAESDARHSRGEDSEGVRGLKSLGVRDLNYRLAFLANSVHAKNDNNLRYATNDTDEDGNENAIIDAEKLKKEMDPREWETIYEMSQDRNLYTNLINSLFPSIHGNDEVKKGIMLMLFGGVPKVTPEATTLRGDINVCIVGDPSTAKSQLLKQVADFSPRAVYTSGKASSAAGLTAAVVKDEESSEFVIEAGALMLADNGVCCIDEFDKMDVGDQVAIHEAMEQQTISITKAGVRATLNARTSILAAANPVGGRYDRSKNLKQNIQMSPPIMSRFDLFFILVDECNETTDYAIARRIIDLHSKAVESIERVYSPDDIRRYIRFARLFNPKVSNEAKSMLVDNYKLLRMRDTGSGVKSSWRITVRQLESMIRIAEANARLHCSDVVLEKHVKEAFRLLNKSIIRVDQPDVHLDEDEDDEDQPMEQDENQDVSNIDPQAQNNSEDDASIQKQPSQGAAETKTRLKLTYEAYKTMASKLVRHLRGLEALNEEGADEIEETCLTRSQLVDWYLNEALDEAEVETQEELLQRKVIVERVIDRLAYQDHVLIPLTQTARKRTSEEDPFIVVHPNFSLDAD